MISSRFTFTKLLHFLFSLLIVVMLMGCGDDDNGSSSSGTIVGTWNGSVDGAEPGGGQIDGSYTIPLHTMLTGLQALASHLV